MENNTENFRQPLFNHLSNEHDLTLLDSELDEIISIASKISDEKRKEEIKDKYRIELILKEMWVWNIHKDEAELTFVICKNTNVMPYVTYGKNGMMGSFTNTSETDPNQKQEISEPKVGDKGYFWHDNMKSIGCYFYGELAQIPPNRTMEYMAKYCGYFQNFSTKKQPWMK